MKLIRVFVIIGVILFLFNALDIKFGNQASERIDNIENTDKPTTGFLTTFDSFFSDGTQQDNNSDNSTSETSKEQQSKEEPIRKKDSQPQEEKTSSDTPQDKQPKEKNTSSDQNNDKEQKEDGLIYTVAERCVDGDTIEFYNESKQSVTDVRILNIDTPETHGEKMPFGKKASSFCKSVLEGNEIALEPSKKKDPYDDYGRLLANVWINEQLYQEKIVKEGLAIVKYVYEPDTEYVDRLYNAQQSAEDNSVGVFSLDDYVVDGDYANY